MSDDQAQPVQTLTPAVAAQIPTEQPLVSSHGIGDDTHAVLTTPLPVFPTEPVVEPVAAAAAPLPQPFPTQAPSVEPGDVDQQENPLDILEKILAEASAEKDSEAAKKEEAEAREQAEMEVRAAKEAEYKAEAAVQIQEKLADLEQAKADRQQVEEQLAAKGIVNETISVPENDAMAIHQLQHQS